MSKFVLIDHSITKYGGHYFEYAINVLTAAKEKGFNTVLAVNIGLPRDIATLDPIDEIHRVYKYDFWGHSASLHKQYSFIQQIKRSISGIIVRLRLSLRYSALGLFWLGRNDLGQLFRMYHAPRRILAWGLIALPLVYIINFLRSIKRLLLALLYPITTGYIGNIGKRLFTTGYIGNIGKRLIDVVIAVFLPLVVVTRHREKFILYYNESKRIAAFGAATHNLLRQISLEEGDIVFIPTLSEIDLLGVLRYFRKARNSHKATWHFVFRRNIFTGRETGYSSQGNNVKAFRNALLHFRNGLSGHHVAFYTDTEKLTAQYNSLNIFQFHTLPIPVNKRLAVEHGKGQFAYPLRAVYSGDARREKGYQHIPGIVRELKSSYMDSGRLVFILQSNFTFKRMENNADIISARNQLDNLAEPGVMLIKDALTSEEYCDVILSSDIGLLLYDRDNYYARSSGALVEFLSAGKPVIVPAGSWLADEFMGEINLHNDRISRSHDIIQRMAGNELWWVNSVKENVGPTRNAGLKEIAGSSCWLQVPKQAGCILVSFRLDDLTPPGVYVEVSVRQVDEYGRFFAYASLLLGGTDHCQVLTRMFRLDERARKILISFRNAFEQFSVYVWDLQFGFLKRSSQLAQEPLGAVGLDYSRIEEVPRLLEDIIVNYVHYEDTARRFSEGYCKKHNSNRLVEILRDRSHSYSSTG